MAAVAVQVGPPPDHGALDGVIIVAPTLSHNEIHCELHSPRHRGKTVMIPYENRDITVMHRGGDCDFVVILL